MTGKVFGKGCLVFAGMILAVVLMGTSARAAEGTIKEGIFAEDISLWFPASDP